MNTWETEREALISISATKARLILLVLFTVIIGTCACCIFLLQTSFVIGGSAAIALLTLIYPVMRRFYSLTYDSPFRRAAAVTESRDEFMKLLKGARIERLLNFGVCLLIVAISIWASAYS